MRKKAVPVSRCTPFVLGNRLRPSLFVRAAELVGIEAPEASTFFAAHNGACVAIRDAAELLARSSFVTYRDFFESLYRADSPMPWCAYYFGRLVHPANREHREFALLFAAEFAKDHNEQLEKRRRRRG